VLRQLYVAVVSLLGLETTQRSRQRTAYPAAAARSLVHTDDTMAVAVQLAGKNAPHELGEAHALAANCGANLLSLAGFEREFRHPNLHAAILRLRICSEASGI
jgi:hypothetical protein